MWRIILKYLVYWLAMTVPAAVLLNVLDVPQMLPTLFALTVFIGIPLLFYLFDELVSYFTGTAANRIAVSYRDAGYEDEELRPTFSPTTGSMMMNENVDVEGRLQGEGRD